MMTTALRTVPESMRVEDALRLMRSAGVRRLIVTADDGSLAGILVLDDVREYLAEDAAEIDDVMPREAPPIGV